MPKEERDLTRVEKHTVSEKTKKEKKRQEHRGAKMEIYGVGDGEQCLRSRQVNPHQQALIKYTCIAAQGSRKKSKKRRERGRKVLSLSKKNDNT